MTSRAKLRRQQAKRDAWNAEMRKDRRVWSMGDVNWDELHIACKHDMALYDSLPEWARDKQKENNG